MDYKIEIRDKALEDLIKSYLWYEDKKPGLDKNLVSEVEASLKYLKKNPLAFPKKKNSFREFNLKKFPYLLIFTVEDTVVTVFAIFHTYLNPNKKPSA